MQMPNQCPWHHSAAFRTLRCGAPPRGAEGDHQGNPFKQVRRAPTTAERARSAETFWAKSNKRQITHRTWQRPPDRRTRARYSLEYTGPAASSSSTRSARGRVARPADDQCAKAGVVIIGRVISVAPLPFLCYRDSLLTLGSK
jgi:hypothetical protein